MSEVIALSARDLGIQGTGLKRHTIIVETRVPIENRGVETKYRVIGRLQHKNRSKRITFIEREPYQDFPILRWLARWQMLRAAGILVPPTVRLTTGNRIYVTDLKSGGAELYGKGMKYYFIEVKKRQAPYQLRPIDYLFLNIMFLRQDELQAKKKQIAERAGSSNLLLPGDDPSELLVQPTGQYDFVTTDVRQARRTDSSYEQAVIKLENEQILKKVDDELMYCVGFLASLNPHYAQLYTQFFGSNKFWNGAELKSKKSLNILRRLF